MDGLGKKPLSLADILRGGKDFMQAWDEAPSTAADQKLIPTGTYRCRVADGKLAESRQKATPSYKVTFEVIEGDHVGRKLFLDLWLSATALRISKPMLITLGFPERGANLRVPCPALDAIAEVVVAMRADNQGRQWNEVRSFKIVEAAPADDFAPADDQVEKAQGEGGAKTPTAGGRFEL